MFFFYAISQSTFFAQIRKNKTKQNKKKDDGDIYEKVRGTFGVNYDSTRNNNRELAELYKKDSIADKQKKREEMKRLKEEMNTEKITKDESIIKLRKERKIAKK